MFVVQSLENVRKRLGIVTQACESQLLCRERLGGVLQFKVSLSKKLVKPHLNKISEE
jgi:hypothetical protein